MSGSTLLDRLGLPRLYERSSDWLKRSLRPLTDREKDLALEWLGDSLPLDKIRIDERAHLGPRQQAFCYVSFHHINCWGPMTDATFIHELVHIWQYTQVGSNYIPRAWRAQRSAAGYDYGGMDLLRQAMLEGRHLLDFNYEQQASIIEDAFRLKNKLPTRYARDQQPDWDIFQYYIDQIKNSAVDTDQSVS